MSSWYRTYEQKAKYATPRGYGHEPLPRGTESCLAPSHASPSHRVTESPSHAWHQLGKDRAETVEKYDTREWAKRERMGRKAHLHRRKTDESAGDPGHLTRLRGDTREREP